jgi:hypothetical protein
MAVIIKCSSIGDVVGLSVVFTLLHKKNESSIFKKQMVICYQIRVLNQCL